MDKITKEDILKAINEINKYPDLRKGRASSTYDLIYEGIDYPPKLLISIANKFATGVELAPEDFEGGIGTDAFRLLENFGFEIEKKRDFVKILLNDFIEQGKTSNLKTSSFPKKFRGLNLKVKFGNLEVAQYEFPNKMNWDDAKKACEALGYGWRLPNRDELKTLYNRVGAIGGFAHDDYWSSSEDGNVGAWVQSFNSGVQYRSKKFTYPNYVRAVRAF